MDPVTWLRPEYQGREAELIHLSAAADLVGVGRSAVSNWAARHSNFPKIVMLTGVAPRRQKFVDQEEFLTFARAQLARKSRAGKNKAPRRPRVVIESSRVTHWEAQIERLSELEVRYAAQLKNTQARLGTARSNLRTAKAALAAEINAAQALTEETP
jgi:hypothetical protein